MRLETRRYERGKKAWERKESWEKSKKT
jgi:hypothetical protein